MRTLISMAGIAAMALAAVPAQATDFGPLMDVARATWPDKSSIAVVADYDRSSAEIQALARAAGSGRLITVLDTRGRRDLEKAGHLLAQRIKPDFLVLLPDDPQVPDGSFNASFLLGQAAFAGIPALATTPKGVAQGAVIALGAATGMELLVTEKMIGTVEVILPQRGRYLPTQARADHGMAEITRIAAF